MIKYSFIIPVKEINDYIRETVPEILKMERDDYEIIIYPNEVNAEAWPKTRQIASGNVGPAIKRNMAINDALGEIIIFIDDDAYPQSDFLEKLDKVEFNNEIAAVGGPAITPKNDNFWQKVSGAVFLSNLSGGCPERYVPIGGKRFVDDWPTVNLSIKKDVFKRIGGFDSNYWPGEDTLLCLDIVMKQKMKILYDPELIVFHHRRSGLLRHMKQIAGYGVHRGFFAKKYPETSFNLKYFIPSLFLIYLIFGAILSLFYPQFFILYLIGLGVYLIALMTATKSIYHYEKNILIALNATYYIFFTHITYGWYFLKGLATKELKSKFR